MKIAVVGTGYVGLSMATLLSQRDEVVAMNIVADRVDKIISVSVQFRMNTLKIFC